MDLAQAGRGCLPPRASGARSLPTRAAARASGGSRERYLKRQRARTGRAPPVPPELTRRLRTTAEGRERTVSVASSAAHSSRVAESTCGLSPPGSISGASTSRYLFPARIAIGTEPNAAPKPGSALSALCRRDGKPKRVRFTLRRRVCRRERRWCTRAPRWWDRGRTRSGMRPSGRSGQTTTHSGPCPSRCD